MGINKLARKSDPMGTHVRLYHSILDSPAWIALDFSAQSLYVHMRRKLYGINNGDIEATITTLRHAGFKSSSTLAKALRALEAVGLIRKTRQGGATFGGRVCSLYRFTDVYCPAKAKLGSSALPPSKEWKSIASLKEAKTLIALGHSDAACRAAATRARQLDRGEKSRLQESKVEASKSEVQRLIPARRRAQSTSDIEVVRRTSVRRRARVDAGP